MDTYKRNITSANGSDPFATLLPWDSGLAMEPQDKPIEMNLGALQGIWPTFCMQ